MEALLGDVIEQVAAQFEHNELFFGHGTDNAWDEAVALVLGVTGLPDDRGAFSRPVAAAHEQQIAVLARRRVEERIPLAYLLGRASFAGYEFVIGPGVVIPRSPIAQLIVSGFAPWLTRQPRTIVDVCCGCGCIGIACAQQFPDAEVFLIDIDPVAVALAQRNVVHHGLENRVTALQSDLFDALHARRFDLIVSNPPYVDAVDMKSLPPEFVHEPERGLAAGTDGLMFAGRLLELLSRWLEPDGMFVCEVGASAAALSRKYPRLPFVWPDLPDGGEGVFLLYGCDAPQAGVSIRGPSSSP